MDERMSQSCRFILNAINVRTQFRLPQRVPGANLSDPHLLNILRIGIEKVVRQGLCAKSTGMFAPE